MIQNATTAGWLLLGLVVCVVLVWWDNGDTQDAYDDLFFGIGIGSDSADVAATAERESWHRVLSTSRSARYAPSMFFIKIGYSNQLATNLDGRNVTSFWRMWTIRSSDTTSPLLLHDSLEQVFNRRFPRESDWPKAWIIATSPDTIFLNISGSRPTYPSGPYVLETSVITARERQRMRDNATNC